MIQKATDLAKEIIRSQKDIKIAVDMTAGNGYDSLFILDELKPEKLYAFDIQERARDNSLALIGGRPNYEFILDSHANIDKYIHEEIDLAVYNLGYLPKADKSITTLADSTIESLEKVLDLLKTRGKVITTVYPGHPEGAQEAKDLEDFFTKLDQRQYIVLKMEFPNQVNKPPFIYYLTKKELVENR